MRFAQSASKFEGLQLCHLFFHVFLSLFRAISLNVEKSESRKWREQVGTLSLKSTSRSPNNRYLKKWRPWFSPGMHKLNIDWLVINWYSLTSQQTRLNFRWKDFFCEDSNNGKIKKETTCFAYLCCTEALNYKKSMTVWKLCEISFK